MAAAKAAEKKAKLAELSGLDPESFAAEGEEQEEGDDGDAEAECPEEDEENEEEYDDDEALVPKRPAAVMLRPAGAGQKLLHATAKKRPAASRLAAKKRPAAAMQAGEQQTDDEGAQGRRDQTKQRKFNEVEDSLPQPIKDLFANAGKHPLGKRARQTQLVNQLFTRKEGRLVLHTDSPFFQKDSSGQ